MPKRDRAADVTDLDGYPVAAKRVRKPASLRDRSLGRVAWIYHGGVVVRGDIDYDAKNARSLEYYSANGFEARCPRLGAQKQILGGGPYAQGVGFALGVDRVVLAVVGRTREG